MIAECDMCRTTQECEDDGEALICVDRGACQARCEKALTWTPEYLLSLLTKETECALCHTVQPCINAGEAGFICVDQEACEKRAARRLTMDEAVELAFAMSPIPLPDEGRYGHRVTGAMTGECGACGTVQPCFWNGKGWVCIDMERCNALYNIAQGRCACGGAHHPAQCPQVGALLWANEPSEDEPTRWSCPECARLDHMCGECVQAAKGGALANPICTVHGCKRPATREGLIPGMPVCDECGPPAWERLRKAVLVVSPVEALRLAVTKGVFGEKTLAILRASLEAADADALMRAEQLAHARQHVNETFQRWQFEAQTTGIPF